MYQEDVCPTVPIVCPVSHHLPNAVERVYNLLVLECDFKTQSPAALLFCFLGTKDPIAFPTKGPVMFEALGGG